jgi:Zn-dependent protease
MPIDALFFISILLMSVVIHEVAHGYAADLLGDPTARYAGRLTLNPLPHLDLVGSILVPLLLLFSNAGFFFAWAKPVPYNPYNLRNQRWGTLVVGIAGVLVNFATALIFGLMIRFSGVSGEGVLIEPFFRIAILIVGLNLGLGIFNLIPVPPLDGSKVLFSLLPYRFMHIERFFEQYWFVLILLVFFFGGSIVLPLLSFAFRLVTGLPLGVYGAVLPF